MIDIDFIVEELLLEGLGGPDWARVSKYAATLGRELHYDPFQPFFSGQLSTTQTAALWDLFRVYTHPTPEYIWVNELTEERRKYIANWVLKIFCRQAFRLDDRNLITTILEGDYNPASPYVYLKNTKSSNSVSLELFKRVPHLGPEYTKVILAYLHKQYIHHTDELAGLVPWLVSFLGLKPSGRGYSRIFHSDRSTQILRLFSKIESLEGVVISECEPLLLSKKKSERLAAKAILDYI